MNIILQEKVLGIDVAWNESDREFTGVVLGAFIDQTPSGSNLKFLIESDATGRLHTIAADRCAVAER